MKRKDFFFENVPCTEFIKERVYTAETLEEIDTAGTHTKQHYTICLDQPQPTTSTTLRNVDLLMSPDTKKSNQTSKQALPQSRASSAILPNKSRKGNIIATTRFAKIENNYIHVFQRTILVQPTVLQGIRYGLLLFQVLFSGLETCTSCAV